MLFFRVTLKKCGFHDMILAEHPEQTIPAAESSPDKPETIDLEAINMDRKDLWMLFQDSGAPELYLAYRLTDRGE